MKAFFNEIFPKQTAKKGEKEMKENTKKLVTQSMLCAISIVLVALIRIPLFPAAPFLEYDPADISVLLGTLLFGPLSGLFITIVVSVLQGIIFSAQSGIIGIIMHIFATGIFAIVTGLLFQKKKGLFLSLFIGALAMTFSMIIWNLIFTPLFLGRSINEVLPMMLPVIIPFNLIKGAVNAIGAGVLYQLLKKTKVF